MYLTNLASIARSAGLRVVENGINKGWQDRGHNGMGDIRTIVVHHTAGSTAKADPRPMGSLNTLVVGRSDLKGPLCHYGLGRDGSVYPAAAGKAWHAGFVKHIDYVNSHSIGIEMQNAGTKSDPWPEEQVEAAVELCASLCVAFGLDASDVLGHREICQPAGRKIDPTLDMVDFRRRVRNAIAERADRTTVRPKPAAPAYTLVGLAYYRPLRLMKGARIQAIQRKVGVKDDGKFGKLTKAAVIRYQKSKHLVPDGVVGADTAHSFGWGFKP